MNILNFTEKYPKATELAMNFALGSGNAYRFLYDFFDKHGVYCFVFGAYQSKWGSEMVTDKEDIFYGYKHDSRGDAEEFVFNKAFEYLEEQLKQENENNL